jgi:hypothetical protein
VEKGCPEKYPLVAKFPIPSARSIEHREAVQLLLSPQIRKHHFLGARIMSFVIQKGGLIRTRIRPRISRLFFLKTRAHDRKLKYLDHLSTERPSKLCVAAYPSESPGSRVKSPPWTPRCSRSIVFSGGAQSRAHQSIRALVRRRTPTVELSPSRLK